MYNRNVDREILFDWDEYNATHLARHGIERSEVEEFFWADPSIRDHEVVDGEDRWTSVGATSSLRILVLVFTVRHKKIRAITGWDADWRTRKEYMAERRGMFE